MTPPSVRHESAIPIRAEGGPSACLPPLLSDVAGAPAPSTSYQDTAQGPDEYPRADASFLGQGGGASALLPHIPTGRRHATSVSQLSALSGLSDREVRAEIERLLKEDRVPVCTLPTTNGVWIADGPEDIDAADKHLKAKAMSLLRRRRALRLCREPLVNGRLF